MDQNGYLSISEFAQVAGVSHQAVYKQLQGKLRDYAKLIAGKKMVSVKALTEVYRIPVVQVEKYFAQRDAQKNPHTKAQWVTQTDETMVAVIEMLRKQLEVKDRQLEVKDQQIEELHGIIEQQHKIMEQQNALVLAGRQEVMMRLDEKGTVTKDVAVESVKAEPAKMEPKPPAPRPRRPVRRPPPKPASRWKVPFWK